MKNQAVSIETSNSVVETMHFNKSIHCFCASFITGILFAIICSSVKTTQSELTTLQQNQMLTPTSTSQWHPCERPCVKGRKKMQCYYRFNIEIYYVLSLACYSCPFTVTDCYRKDCVPTDGTKKSVVVANRQLPGPPINVCKDDTIIVDVANNGNPQSTSIHWHGIRQKTTQYMDGVSYITQCPIQPYDTFRYTFPVPDAGTYFWHGHTALQKVDGLFGIVVIRQPEDTQSYLYDYDLYEHAIIINDWFQLSATEEFTKSEFDYIYFHPESILVNGRGRYENFTMNGTSGVYQTPLKVFTVQYGKRYRFRIIGSSVICSIEVSIDAHRMEIIQTDGRPVEPLMVDGVNVQSGERYDFILNANNTVANYWMKFRGLGDCNENFTSAYQLAILRYEGAPIQDPLQTPSYDYTRAHGFILNPYTPETKSLATAVVVLNSTLSDDKSIETKTPDIQFFIYYDYVFLNNSIYNKPRYYPIFSGGPLHRGHPLPLVNDIFLTMPPSPLLSQFNDIPKKLLCNPQSLRQEGKNCTKEFCECVHLINANLNAVVELVLLDKGTLENEGGNTDHPFHLHGNSFRVVAMGRLEGNVTTETILQLSKENKIPLKLHKAVVKDTISVPVGGYAILRFYADNPGFWFLHCHNDVHMEVGMGLIIQVGKLKDLPKVPRWFPKCNSFPPSKLMK